MISMNRTLIFLNFFVSSSVTIKLNGRVDHKIGNAAVCFCTSLSKLFLYNINTYSKMSGGENDNKKCTSLLDFSLWSLKSDPKYLLLPQDTDPENYVRLYVKNAIFSKVSPTPIKTNVRLVCASKDAMANILDLHPSVAESPEFISFVVGDKLPTGAHPVAHRYGGHQFGYWAEQLGDGRAHLIGEYINGLGHKWELQLKGSGPTPYSRQGDGRAVLRSSIREMVVSEAMHYLGVPTTRAAALVVSDDPVIRDIYYNGNPIAERAAIVLRLSPSWFRIGSLEILAKSGETELLRKLCDHVIKEHYPAISLSDEEKYIKFYTEVAHSTLTLVSKWQGYGFTHGVLNTDNMSLLGLTIDYGPFGFVDFYDADYVPNHSDDGGRYAFGKQMEVAIWNLLMLGSALSPLLRPSDREHITYIHNSLEPFGKAKILKVFLKKLGIKEERAGDELLVQQLLEMMEQSVADFTMTFWQLGEVDVSSLTTLAMLQDKWALKRLATHHTWPSWVEAYTQRLGRDDSATSSSAMEGERRKIMSAVNPRYVPRNWILQDAIKAAESNDYTKVRFLMDLIEKPFTINPEAEKLGYASEPPRWAHRLQLSCSS